MESPDEVRGRLLVVHVTRSIRSDVASAVDDLGFELTEAGSFAQAVQLAATGAAFTGVVLSAHSLHQPGLSAAEALRSIRAAAGTDEVIVLFDSAPDLELPARPLRAESAVLLGSVPGVWTSVPYAATSGILPGEPATSAAAATPSTT